MQKKTKKWFTSVLFLSLILGLCYALVLLAEAEDAPVTYSNVVADQLVHSADISWKKPATLSEEEVLGYNVYVNASLLWENNGGITKLNENLITETSFSATGLNKYSYYSRSELVDGEETKCYYLPIVVYAVTENSELFIGEADILFTPKYSIEGLRATSPTNDSILLSWDENPGAEAGYDVYLKHEHYYEDENRGHSEIVETYVYHTDDTSLLISDLVPGGNYYYNVAAVMDCGCNIIDEPRSYHGVIPGGFSYGTNVQNISFTPTSATIQWYPIEKAYEYQIVLCTAVPDEEGGTNWEMLKNFVVSAAEAEELSYKLTFTDLTEGQNYEVTMYAHVHATDHDCIIGPNRNYFTPGYPAPELVDLTTTGTSATIQWTPVETAVNYTIELYNWVSWQDENGLWISTYEKVGTYTTAETSYTWDGLTTSRHYEASIHATVASGSDSGELTIDFWPTWPPLGAPKNVTLTNITYHSAAVQWDPVEGANGYQLTIFSENAAGLNETKTVTIAGTSYQLTDLIAGRWCDIDIYPLNIDESFSYSDRSGIEFKTTEHLYPKEFTYSDLSATSVHLQWSAVKGAVQYKLYIKHFSDEYDWVIDEATTTDTFYTLTGLTEGIEYSVLVYAVPSDCNCEGTSNSIRFIPTTIPAPDKLIISDVTKNSATLSWNAVDSAVGYYVQAYGYTGEEREWIYVTDTSYTFTKLEPATYYDVFIYAIDADGKRSPYESQTYFQTANTLPPPENLEASEATEGTFVLRWNAVKGAIGYNVYADGIKMNDTPLTETTFTITGREDVPQLVARISSTFVRLIAQTNPSAEVSTAPITWLGSEIKVTVTAIADDGSESEASTLVITLSKDDDDTGDTTDNTDSSNATDDTDSDTDASTGGTATGGDATDNTGSDADTSTGGTASGGGTDDTSGGKTDGTTGGPGDKNTETADNAAPVLVLMGLLALMGAATVTLAAKRRTKGAK